MSPEHVASLLFRRGLRATALCGAGSGGRVFLNALRDKNVDVTCVVDRDSARWGSTFEGIPVCALDQALEAGERTFVAGSLVYGAEMKAQVEQRASELGIGVTVFASLRPRGLSSC
jgi:FlaA1/EpsC-like NDP-sugar epimerase